MTEEQENIIRFIFSQIRKVRFELDELYNKRKKLESISDNFYVSDLNELWTKTHTQLTDLCNKILDRYMVLKSLETQLLNVILDGGNPKNTINPLESTK